MPRDAKLHLPHFHSGRREVRSGKIQSDTETALFTPGGDLDWQALDEDVQAIAGTILARFTAPTTFVIRLADPREAWCHALAANLAGHRFAIPAPGGPDHETEALLSCLAPFHVLEEPLPREKILPAALPEPCEKLITFTSGSTSAAKAIDRTLASWQASFRAIAPLMDWQADDRLLTFASLSHSAALFAAVQAAYEGLPLGLMATFQARQALELCARMQASVLFASPAHLKLMLQAFHAGKMPPLAKVRLIVIGGARWNRALAAPLGAMFPLARTAEFYGTAETSFLAWADASTPEGAVGKVLDEVSIEVRGTKGQALPSGQAGTLWIKSDQSASGYIFPDAELESGGGGLITLGETGMLDAQRNLYLEGRAERMVTVAGHNVFLDQIEAVLEGHPGVRLAAVVSQRDQLRENIILAVIESSDPSLSTEGLKRFCRDILGANKVPHRFYFCAKIPLTPAGKIDLQSCLGEAWKDPE